jgi:hypothetical protein
VEPKRVYKDVVYDGLVANGLLLTPVLFTSDPQESGQVRTLFRMPVKYVQGVKGPGNKTTEIWLDILGATELSDHPVVIADNLKSYFTRTLREELSDLDIQLLHMPPLSLSLSLSLAAY